MTWCLAIFDELAKANPIFKFGSHKENEERTMEQNQKLVCDRTTSPPSASQKISGELPQEDENCVLVL